MEKNLELLRKLMEILGNVTLAEAATWLEVEENARQLIEEVERDENLGVNGN